MKRTLLSLLFSNSFISVIAQGTELQKGGIDNLMRSSGRIYVVVAVMLVILIGIILYLLRIEQKIKDVETDTV